MVERRRRAGGRSRPACRQFRRWRQIPQRPVAQGPLPNRLVEFHAIAASFEHADDRDGDRPAETDGQCDICRHASQIELQRDPYCIHPAGDDRSWTIGSRMGILGAAAGR